MLLKNLYSRFKTPYGLHLFKLIWSLVHLSLWGNIVSTGGTEKKERVATNDNLKITGNNDFMCVLIDSWHRRWDLESSKLLDGPYHAQQFRGTETIKQD